MTSNNSEIRKKLSQSIKSDNIHQSLQQISEIAHQGNLNLALELYLKILNEFERRNDDFGVGKTCQLIGDLHRIRGDFDIALDYLRKALTLFKSSDEKEHLPSVYNRVGLVYQKQGLYGYALTQHEKSLRILKGMDNEPETAETLYNLILFSESTGRDVTQKYLRTLKDLAESTQDKEIRQRTTLAEAIWLKNSTRLKPRVKAQEMLEELVSEEIVSQELTISAMLNLCDLLLDELKHVGNEEVLKETQALLNKIYDVSIQQQSNILTIQTLMLRAKFVLLEGDFHEATSFLKQAREIAREKKLEFLKHRVEEEENRLNSEIDKFKSIISKNATIIERIDQAQLKEYITEALELRNDMNQPMRYVPPELAEKLSLELDEALSKVKFKDKTD